MAIKFQGNTGTVAEVNSAHELEVNLPMDETLAGYANISACCDDGNVIGTRTVRELEATEDFRLRIGQDSILFQEGFAGTAINSSVVSTTG